MSVGRARIALAAAFAAAAPSAGCANGKPDLSGATIRGRTLSVYVSLPFEGPSAVSGRAVLDGARLALEKIHARIGHFRIALKVLDDATAARGEWDPGQTSNDARLAALDSTTVGYIGELDSGASAVSIPILNRAGIAQISPTSTAVGLTSNSPGAQPGEPEKYYPTGVRTFARVAPDDTVQAAAQVSLQRSFGCTRTFVVDDGEVDGEDIATSFDLAARSAGLDVLATRQFDPRAVDFRALAQSIAASGADCVLIAAITDSHAAMVTRQLAAAIPGARIFAAAPLAESTYARSIPNALDGRIVITSPALAPTAYPAGARAFAAAYAQRYGAPQPDAILGYEAMSLMLSAIARATGQGRRAARRANVVREIFATRNRSSVLGRFSIDVDGDTTLASYGVWRIVAGRLRFWKVLDTR